MNFCWKLLACALFLCAPGCASTRLVDLRPMSAAPCRIAAAGIAWAGPSGTHGHGDDRARLSAWCESVGPAMIAAASAPSSIDLSADGLAIVTWNIHEGGGDLERLVEHVRGGPRNNPHLVILLQEVARAHDDVPSRFPETVRAPGRIRPKHAPTFDIAAVATRLGLSLAYVPSMRNGRSVEQGEREDRGSAILSTLPLSDVVGIELPWVSQRRVAVMATVTARLLGAPWTLRVVNAHFDNRLGRSSQAAALARFVGALDTQQVPTVVGGDLNSWFGARDGAVRRIEDVIARIPECGGAPTFVLGLRLDHLFTTLPKDVRAGCEVAAFFGSDHRPIVLRLFGGLAPAVGPGISQASDLN